MHEHNVEFFGILCEINFGHFEAQKSWHFDHLWAAMNFEFLSFLDIFKWEISKKKKKRKKKSKFKASKIEKMTILTIFSNRLEGKNSWFCPHHPGKNRILAQVVDFFVKPPGQE